jgi:anaerobic magnesium-protoporphyrin IX monomethyl ester cyclase
MINRSKNIAVLACFPKMVLFQAPGTCRNFTRSGSLYPPLGLCQIAACAPPDTTLVIDADTEGWSDDEAFEQVAARQPQAVGMTATSYTLELVEKWAKKFAAIGIRVVVGGPHATLAPLDLLNRCPSIEAVVRGEGEAVIGPLISRFANHSDMTGIPGVLTRGASGIPDLLRIENMEMLPFPRFDDLPIKLYGCPDARRRPMVTMATTRGCPHRCGFCSSPELLGRKVRGFSVERTLDELERLSRGFGVREVSFVDDVFTIKRSRTLALCRGMASRKIDLTWFCNARADQVTTPLAKAMASAGCHQVYLGFESGSQAILDGINKGTTIERLEQGARILQEQGIERSVGFVIGLPGESDETIAQTIEMVHRVKPERVQFTRFTPLVGSPLARFNVLGGFHVRSADQVGLWIDQCYDSIEGERWGRESI